jgi:hypothetical protein
LDGLEHESFVSILTLIDRAVVVQQIQITFSGRFDRSTGRYGVITSFVRCVSRCEFVRTGGYLAARF